MGGTIELGEPSANALKREFKEEIGADIQIVRSLNVLENIYALKEQTFHEITLIYEVEFEERHLLERDYFVVTGAGKKPQQSGSAWKSYHFKKRRFIRSSCSTSLKIWLILSN
ncbi:NUDIX hydrolase [Planococcus antarcticus DSM 14505]|uniref:NUDIX hydrolase n=1 Tax=Planococcus antarcticus DSM 14505 TaxID=1185653 RepID=A0AA87IMC2_9BACL|nr:NUDIX hydrolase [Planococcus antarcticus DSM 14505]